MTTLSEGVVAVGEDTTGAVASVVAAKQGTERVMLADPIDQIREAISPASAVRPMTFADVDWFIDLGIKRYPPDYDPVGGEFWLRNRVLVAPTHHLAIRTDRAACITALSAEAWLPAEWIATVSSLVGDEGANIWDEVLPLLRASRDWAKRKRCVMWKVGSQTKYDLGPLARRLGAVEGDPLYVIDWSEERWAAHQH